MSNRTLSMILWIDPEKLNEKQQAAQMRILLRHGLEWPAIADWLVDFYYDEDTAIYERYSALYDKNSRTIQILDPSDIEASSALFRDERELEQCAIDNGWIPAEDDISLPKWIEFSGNPADRPPMPEELISGVLRQGHKMLVTGDSKAGKSFLLLNLALSFATGTEWLGYQCRKCKVLYVNLEIDKDSCMNRMFDIADARHLDLDTAIKPILWSLRGRAKPLNELVGEIISAANATKAKVIILDPIYKVITGDENSATEMGKFCNQFDRIARATHCGVIYCHHHAKGMQGNKRTIDRASGSGVFARDPDACVDLSMLEVDEDERARAPEKATIALRMEMNLREFANPEPVNVWYVHPLHIVDNETLKSAEVQGTRAAGRKKNRKVTTAEGRRLRLQNAYDNLEKTGNFILLKDLAKELNLATRTVREHVEKNSDLFVIKSNFVFRVKGKTGQDATPEQTPAQQD